MRGAIAAILIWLISGAGALAGPEDDLQALIDATIVALGTGDTGQAIATSQKAEALARQIPEPDPQRYAFALNNHAYALSLEGRDPERSRSLLFEAMAYLAERGAAPSEAWVTAAANHAMLELALGDADAARSAAHVLVRTARGSAWHAGAAGTASSVFFELRDFPEAAALLQELLAVDSSVIGAVYGDVFVAYADAQHEAADDGRVADAAALADARIAILRAFPIDGAVAFEKEILLQKFMMLYNNDDFGAAADALRRWSAFGSPGPEDIAFLESMAPLLLQYVQISGETERRDVQLGRTQLAVAFAESLGQTANPAIGLALREQGAAETRLGQIDAAAQSLRRAADILSRSAEGRAALHLVLEDLAANARFQGDLGLALELYQQAEAAYEANAVQTLGHADLAINAMNRANLYLDMEHPARAMDLVAAAQGHFDQDAKSGPQKWNARVVGARIAAVRARALVEIGNGAAARTELARAIEQARSAFPAGHPDFALMLANAGDLLASIDDARRALPLLQEALAIYDAALPSDLPEAVETRTKLALYHLISGNREAALTEFRKIVRARKASAYREALPEAAFDFEMLAWLLLDGARPENTEALDEAFTALQWTQITRSAQAVSMMEARAAVSDAGLAQILRRRQDLLEEHRRATSDLLQALARTDTAPSLAQVLSAKLDRLAADLSVVDTDLRSTGLDTESLGAVEPVGLSDVQRLLRPGEALVTFALSGLSADRVPGLDASANRVILITAETTIVASVREASRSRLAARVAAFRCGIAIHDPGCGQSVPGVRGAMMDTPEDGPGETDGFDVAEAYALYRDLFGGIEASLATMDHLIVVAPPELLNMPFAALVTSPARPDRPGATNWLIRSHAISVLPSVASLRTLRSKERGTAQARYLGVGDPIIGTASSVDCAALGNTERRAAPSNLRHLSGATDATGLRLVDPAILRRLARLPDTVCELQAIGRTFGDDGTTLLTGATATEQAIKTLNGSGELASYDVIVFATHGLTAGEAGATAPGLVLTPPTTATAEDDGLLTAAEVATFDLTADLVVLSACNTAAGEDGSAEGLSGLTRAFFHAGAGGVLVTQWAVYSEAAVDVSTGIFAERQAGVTSNAKALRRSILRLLDAPDLPDYKHAPAYWAAFTLVGAS